MAANLAVLSAAVDAWQAHDRDRYLTSYHPHVTLHGFTRWSPRCGPPSATSSPASGKPSRTPAQAVALELAPTRRGRARGEVRCPAAWHGLNQARELLSRGVQPCHTVKSRDVV
jgi:hypothetical protein